MGEQPNRLSRVMRQLAGLVTFVFAFMSVSASLHHHGAGNTDGCPTVSAVVSVALAATTTQPAPRHLAAATPRANNDCALCDWQATAVTLAGAVLFALTVTLPAIAALALSVRLAALCAAPLRRRGLRGPPALLFA